MDIRETEEDIKSRTRRRRSIRNLREGLPGVPVAESADSCYGSLWMESNEPVRKKRRRRSSMFVGLPALHSTPLREEDACLDTSASAVTDARLDTSISAVTDAKTIDQRLNENTRDVCDANREERDNLTDREGCKNDAHVSNSGSDVSLYDYNQVGEMSRHTDKSAAAEEIDHASSRDTTKCAADISAVLNSSSGHADVNCEGHNEPSYNISSPDISMARLSPSSMSPDFPVSPAMVENMVNHGESYIESEGLLTQGKAQVVVMDKVSKGVYSCAELNSSDKENISHNLDVTPADVQNECNSKDSPSFFSLCKSIAGKVAEFVRTSPTYLTNAIVTSKSPACILTDAKDNVNSEANICSPGMSDNHQDSMSVWQQEDDSVDSRQMLQDKVNRTLEEMEAQINAESAEKSQTHPHEKAEIKSYAKLVKPCINKDVIAVSEASSDKNSSITTNSIKKKRDRKTYFQTFNAISDVLNRDDTETSDAVFASNVWLKVPKAPERPKSRSSSTNDVDFMNQLMYEGGNSEKVSVDVADNGKAVTDTATSSSSETAGLEAAEKEPESCYSSSVSSDMPSVEVNFQSLFHNADSINEKRTVGESTDTTKDEEEKYDDKQNLEAKEKKTEIEDTSNLLQIAADIDSKNYTISTIEEQDIIATDAAASLAESAEEMVSKHLQETNPSSACKYAAPGYMTGTSDIQEKDREEEQSQTSQAATSLLNIDAALSSSEVSKRKRKHEMPATSFTEKTSMTAVKESTETITEKKPINSVGQKKVKAKSVAAKRKSGQFSIVTEIVSEGNDKEQKEAAKCSAPKKQKVGVASDVSNVSEGESSEISKVSPATSNIEERISKLAIENSTEKANVSSKSKGKARNYRRRSAKLTVTAGTEIVVHDVQETSSSGKEVAKSSAEMDQATQDKVTPDSIETKTVSEELQSKPCIKESEESQSVGSAKAKRKGRRRSSTFKETSVGKSEDSPETAMEVSKITDEISQVHLKEAKTTESIEDQKITVDNFELPEDNVVPRRRKRRSAESAALKIQMYCEDTESLSPGPSTSGPVTSGPVTATKGGRKRKLESKTSHENLEQLYKNKNYVKPEEHKPWQTIFESPPATGDLYGKKRQQRLIDFEKPTQLKLRRRLQRAVKNGWDPKKKKKFELKDEVVELKLVSLSQELDESSDSLAESLKDIVDTK